MFFKNIRVTSQGNKHAKWSELKKSGALTLGRIRLPKNPQFFCIGSCFAQNLRSALEYRKQKCLPDYKSITYDYDLAVVDALGQGIFHMNHYSSKSILQEFRRSLHGESGYDAIRLDGVGLVAGKKLLGTDLYCYQDPYRREVFSKQAGYLEDLSAMISGVVKDGAAEANVFVITLGLIELFQNKISGRVFNQFPGYAGGGYANKTFQLEFRRQTEPEVTQDLRELISLIKQLEENNVIVLSVSPVPLQMTFSGCDVYIANMYSKSVLRAAVENVVNEELGIYYFPSYEIASNMGSSFYQDRDLRHPKDNYVSAIVETFLRCSEVY